MLVTASPATRYESFHPPFTWREDKKQTAICQARHFLLMSSLLLLLKGAFYPAAITVKFHSVKFRLNTQKNSLLHPSTRQLTDTSVFPTRIKAVIFWLQERLFQRVMFNPSAKLSVPGLQLPFHMWGDIFYFFLNRLYLHQKGFLEFRQWRQDQQVKQDKNSKVTSLQTSHGNISTVCVL